MGIVLLEMRLCLREHAPTAREREQAVNRSGTWDVEPLARSRAQERDAHEEQHDEHQRKVAIEARAHLSRAFDVAIFTSGDRRVRGCSRVRDAVA